MSCTAVVSFGASVHHGAPQRSATQEDPPMEDRRMKPQALAARLRTRLDWVDRHGPALPCTVQRSPRQPRFSAQGLAHRGGCRNPVWRGGGWQAEGAEVNMRE